jgi:glycosyltransferase involved in cell wall biosynthesis
MPSRMVSIVIPTYNRPALLLETLATVFAQTFEDYEIVIINDGSTDDTVGRLAPLQQTHGEKLRVITQANGGIGVARNRGIDEARGKYVALLDHDDLWMPEKLRVQVEFMQSHPECVACGTLFCLSTAPDRPHFQRREVAGADGIVDKPFWHTAHGRDVFQTCTLMIDRRRAAGLRYGEERNAIEDMQFHALLTSRGKYGIAGETPLALYRIDPGGASKNTDYFYEGARKLRRMFNAGAFDALPAAERADFEYWLGHLFRFVSVGQINLGRRGRGLELYRLNFGAQLRQKRFQYLLLYPLMLLTPKWWLDAAYRRKANRRKTRAQLTDVTAHGDAI